MESEAAVNLESYLPQEEDMTPYQRELVKVVKKEYATVKDRADLRWNFATVRAQKSEVLILSCNITPRNPRAAALTIEMAADDSIYLSIGHLKDLEEWWNNLEEFQTLSPLLINAVLSGKCQVWIRFNKDGTQNSALAQFDVPGYEKPLTTSDNVSYPRLWRLHKDIKHFTYEPY